MFVVSGSTGRVGSNVVTELLRLGQPVRALVRSEEAKQYWLDQGAKAAAVDLLDTAALTEVLKGAAGFFALLPFHFDVDDLDHYADAVIASVRTAVESANVQHVVMLSSGGADLAQSTGPITGLHRMEQALLSVTPALTALRPGHFQEKFQDVLPAVLSEGVLPVFGSADTSKPMVATKDIGVHAAHCLMDSTMASGGIDIVGPSYTEREVAEALSHELQKDVVIAEIPEQEWETALEQSGFSPSAAASIAEMYRADDNGLLAPRASSSIAACTPLAETVRATLKKWRAGR